MSSSALGLITVILFWLVSQRFVFLLFSLFLMLQPDLWPDSLAHPTSLHSCLTTFTGSLLLLGFSSYILSLIYRSFTGQAPKYLCDLIRLPASATSLRPLRSLNRHELFFTRARTAMAKTRAFAFIGPALWNLLPPLTRSCL